MWLAGHGKVQETIDEFQSWARHYNGPVRLRTGWVMGYHSSRIVFQIHYYVDLPAPVNDEAVRECNADLIFENGVDSSAIFW